MKKLAIVVALGAAALMGGSAANAADNAAKAKPSNAVTQSPTDISSQHRHHWRHHHHHRHWGHRHYRPYYNSYNYYAPRRYGYYGPGYYGHRHYGGPGVTFSFGGGGW